MYMQIHTSTVVQGEGGGGGWNPCPEFLICCSILKRFHLWWKACDLLNKMTYIYFMGGGAAGGLSLSPSWILPRIRNQVKTARNEYIKNNT